jgi:hypothetical protein
MSLLQRFKHSAFWQPFARVYQQSGLKARVYSRTVSPPVKTITEAALWDVSPVTHAAYPNSSVGLRSLSAWKAARGLVHHRAEGRGLLISIDYDRTFTAAPGLWRSFIVDATERGNRVCCISRRADTEENREELRLAFGELTLEQIILCGGDTQKRSAAAQAGLEVDVWIDDAPQTIPDNFVDVRACEVPDSAGAVFRGSLAGARAAAAASLARMIGHDK